ncbi:MAG: pilin [Patescibacteria group bacterium]
MNRVAKAGALGCVMLFGLTSFAPAVFASTCCKCISPDNPKNNICITTSKPDCASLKTTSENAKVKALTCDLILNESQCKQVSEGGICYGSPVAEPAYTGKSGGSLDLESDLTITPPTLGVSIPGLTFASKIFEREGYVEIPFLAQYIAAASAYLSIVGILAAAVMVVYGGFRYITGSTVQNIQKGKEILIDSIVGMVLVLGAVTILKTINPRTITLEAIRIETIDAIDIGTYNPTVRVGDDPSLASRYTPPVKRTRLPIRTTASSGGPKDIVDDIIAGAEAAGLNPCLVLANCHQETRLNALWNGQPYGTPKEKAIGCGACGVTMNNLRGGTVFAKKIKERYPDFPDLPNDRKAKLTQEDRVRICDWLLKNHEGDAYASALLLSESVNAAKGNEIFGLAGYKAGYVSMQKWATANGCTPRPGYTFKQALTQIDQAMKISCVPHIVAIPSTGAPPPGCPEDKYVCTDAKPNKASVYEGHCSDGRECKAMITDTAVKHILEVYPQIVKDYRCDQ